VNAPVRIKICGITNQEDAFAAIDAGADALGFNLFPGSRRHVRLEDITPWLPSLGGHALRVAVMVNPSPSELLGAQLLFDAVQLHGQETHALCAEAAARGTLWKALPLSLDPTPYQAHALVIDSAPPGAFGGTGVLINLEEASAFVRSYTTRPIWLSGGLHPANITEAVEKVRPFGVDVASGVEAPGNSRRKDSGKIRAFIAAARAA